MSNVIFPPSNQPAKDDEERTSLTNLIVELLGHVASKSASTDTGVDQTPSSYYHGYDLALVARQISLLLVGLIILSSIRVVLRGVTRFLRLTSGGRSRAELGLLVLAQLMVTPLPIPYFSSCISHLKTSREHTSSQQSFNYELRSPLQQMRTTTCFRLFQSLRSLGRCLILLFWEVYSSLELSGL